MNTQDFLIELGTEELPPKALKKLSNALGEGIEKGLNQAKFSYESINLFASPRRLAVRVNQLSSMQPDSHIEKRGPALKAAYDSEGNPTRALDGFVKSCGATIDSLDKLETDKGSWVVYRASQQGQSAESLIPGIVADSISQLPIPKRMRWGANREEFVRPVHWLVMLMGEQVIDCKLLGLTAGNQTRGHRFHCDKTLTIKSPKAYESLLQQTGFVIANYDERKSKIRQAVEEIASTVSGTAVIDENLLDEVTSLNEWPVPLIGRFEERFLDVPSEALISSMKEHQKYFHVVDASGNMLPNFITIANIESKDPSQVVAGNERVIRPRLSDAAFFFETDKKHSLESRREQLKPIIFQAQLGSIYDKTVRVARLAKKIATALKVDEQLAERAGQLSKSDLVTEMVLEFTDLQGIMGDYYARNDGETLELATSLNEQYLPKYAGGALPVTTTGRILAISDKLDSLVGIFGISQPPTGTKDPFALRRAALGVLRIMVECEINLDLKECIQWSMETFGTLLTNKQVEDQLLDYMLERFKSWYEEEGVSIQVFAAVHARRPTQPTDFASRIKAVNHFIQLPEATALAAANKRVSNILSKVSPTTIPTTVIASLFEEEAEKALATDIKAAEKALVDVFAEREYTKALTVLARLQQPVDLFFEKVMVMSDNKEVKNNRLALLKQLQALFLRIADISLLS
jgi:glycyl-tRNA synthetase beta chain